MTDIHVTPIPTGTVRAYQRGEPDANGMAPERAVSDGSGNPCRHCLTYIPKGAQMLVLGHRPFAAAQPYAETGPVFICAHACDPFQGPGLPPVLDTPDGEARLLKGYSPDDRIVYGLGRIVPLAELAPAADEMLNDPRVAYVHVRSSLNNCYTCRIDRA